MFHYVKQDFRPMTCYSGWAAQRNAKEKETKQPLVVVTADETWI